MRKFTFLKMMLLAVVMLAGSMGIKAQLLVENFDYTAGTVLATSTSARVVISLNVPEPAY